MHYVLKQYSHDNVNLCVIMTPVYTLNYEKCTEGTYFHNI